MIDPSFTPKLAAKVRLKLDRHSGSWLLLYPERGRILDEFAAAIVRRCDGTLSISEIADRLAREYAGPRDEIERDAIRVVMDLAHHRLLA